MLVSWDVESTGLNPWGADRPFALSLTWEDNRTEYFHWYVNPFTRKVQKPSETERKYLTSVLSNPDIAKVGHNVRFDCWMVELAWGIEVRGEIHDTMFMAHACNPLEPAFKLKVLANKYLKISNDDEQQLGRATKSARLKGKKLGWKLGEDVAADYWMPSLLATTEADRNACREYCVLDTQRTISLYRMYQAVMEKDEYAARVYERERKLWWTAKRMEGHGVRVDIDVLNKEINWCTAQQQLLRTRLETVFGPFTKKVSDDRMRRYLYGQKTKGGLGLIPDPDKLTEKTKLPSVAKEVLELLAFQVPIVSAKVQLDRISKAKTTYFQNFLNECVKEKDCHIFHAGFNQIGAVTGRFSARLLQTVPKRGPVGDVMQRVRSPFGPRPGCVWLHLDYKGIEARIFAEEARETEMLNIFAANGDVYQDLVHRIEKLAGLDLKAMFVHRDSPGKPGTGARDICKITHLAWMYGEGREKMQRQLGLSSLELADEIIQAMKDAYPKAQPFMWHIAKRAEKTRHIINRYQRRVPIPPPIWEKGKWIEFWYKATNYLIQSTAADMMKSAMPRCEEYLTRHNCGYIVMTIHDELVFEFPTGKFMPRHALALAGLMQGAAEEHFSRVRFPVDASITKTQWSTPEKRFSMAPKSYSPPRIKRVQSLLSVEPNLKEIERFFEKVTQVPGSDCWLWIGSADENGYPQFWYKGKVIGANRYLWCLLGRELGVRQELKRQPTCGDKACVNPNHMMPGKQL